jgi:hypothetical protein
MTDDETAMAYADGELDPIAAKRFEARIAAEPALARLVDAHRALRARLGAAFASVADEALPARLTGPLQSNVVPLEARGPGSRRWWTAGAIAASLAIGIAIGQVRGPQPVSVSGNQLIAAGALGTALDRQLAAEEGAVRVLASFRDSGGAYCRVFTGRPVDGIACREPAGWVLRETRAGSATHQAPAYRQAGSGDAKLLAAAQEMMAGDPLNKAQEAEARRRGWR